MSDNEEQDTNHKQPARKPTKRATSDEAAADP